MKGTLRPLRLVFVAAIALLAHPRESMAGNVPGSAQSIVPELTEIATGITIRSLHQQVATLRQGGASSAAGRYPLAFSLTHRLLQTPGFSGSMDIATAFAASGGDAQRMYFAGLVGELVNVRSAADAGQLQSRGLGPAIGVNQVLTDRLTLTAMLGAMVLNYDVSRGGGSVSGAFRAIRGYGDISLDYIDRAPGGDLMLSFGLTALRQTNARYEESSGASIAPYAFNSLDARLDARKSWGPADALRPYAGLSAQMRLAGSDAGASVVPGHASRQARLAIGLEHRQGLSHFDLGLGANMGDSGFSGLDLQVTYALRF